MIIIARSFETKEQQQGRFVSLKLFLSVRVKIEHKVQVLQVYLRMNWQNWQNWLNWQSRLLLLLFMGLLLSLGILLIWISVEWLLFLLAYVSTHSTIHCVNVLHTVCAICAVYIVIHYQRVAMLLYDFVLYVFSRNGHNNRVGCPIIMTLKKGLTCVMLYCRRLIANKNNNNQYEDIIIAAIQNNINTAVTLQNNEIKKNENGLDDSDDSIINSSENDVDSIVDNIVDSKESEYGAVNGIYIETSIENGFGVLYNSDNNEDMARAEQDVNIIQVNNNGIIMDDNSLGLRIGETDITPSQCVVCLPKVFLFLFLL